MMNSKDLLARLLANENLNVIRANVATASFESITRTLTLPQWKDMTNEIEEMLIGHEVGHALYTTTEHMDKEDFRAIQGYMNVIEDVRIEKKVKARNTAKSREPAYSGITTIPRSTCCTSSTRETRNSRESTYS